MPPSVTLFSEDEDGGMEIYQSPYQKWLWNNCWLDMLKRVGAVDALVLLGDLVDGVNPAEKGMGLWTCDVGQQEITATDMLRMIPARKVYGCQGSGFHVSNNKSSDRTITENLRGTFRYDHFIKPENFTIHAMHKQSGSGRSGVTRKAHGILTEIQAALENEEVYGNVDMVVRAHKHTSVMVKIKDKYGFGIPSWKGRDYYVRSESLHFAPEHGYTYIEVNNGEIDYFDCRRYVPPPNLIRNCEVI